jgi:chromosome segregation ATPase
VAVCEVQEKVDETRELRRELDGEAGGYEPRGGVRVGAGDGEGHEEDGHEAVEEGDGERLSIAALRSKTSQLNAQTKHLALKAAEYREKRAALEHSGSNVRASIAELKQEQKALETQKDIVRRLENSLREYHGLPPDLEASREEVKRVQAELDMWKRKREELFETIGGG